MKSYKFKNVFNITSFKIIKLYNEKQEIKS